MRTGEPGSLRSRGHGREGSSASALTEGTAALLQPPGSPGTAPCSPRAERGWAAHAADTVPGADPVPIRRRGLSSDSLGHMPPPHGEIQPRDSTHSTSRGVKATSSPEGLDTRVNINFKRNQTALYGPDPAEGRKGLCPLPLDALLKEEAQRCSWCQSPEAPGGTPGCRRRCPHGEPTVAVPVRHAGRAARAEPSLQPGQVAARRAGSQEGRVGAALRTSRSLWFAVTSDNFFHTIISSDHNNQSLRNNS